MNTKYQKAKKREIILKKNYDIIIVGGGVYGASLFSRAAEAGFSALLIEKDDFGSGTSSNSLKIIHGGLRYLQQFNLFRMRESVKERRHLMRSVPHLVRTLPFITPTHRNIKDNRVLYKVAFLLSDLIAFDRNSGLEKNRGIPKSHLINPKKCARIIPGINYKEITGGAVWFDAQAINTERLIIYLIKLAEKKGNNAYNYFKMDRLLFHDNRVVGIIAKDSISGEEYKIYGKNTVITAGPWVNEIKERHQHIYKYDEFCFAKAVNILVPKKLSTYAFGLRYNSNKYNRDSENRFLFFTPWRGGTIIGTWYFRTARKKLITTLSKDEFKSCLNRVNDVLSGIQISQEDISFLHVGLVPCLPNGKNEGEPKLNREPIIIDHEKRDNVEGLITVVGIKYTTANSIAKRIIKIINQKKKMSNKIKETKIYNTSLSEEKSGIATKQNIKNEIFSRLKEDFGSEYLKISKLIERDTSMAEIVPGTNDLTKAELKYIIQNEMTIKLSDLMLRRTDLGTLMKPSRSVISYCSKIMALHMGWNEDERKAEVDEFISLYNMKF